MTADRRRRTNGLGQNGSRPLVRQPRPGIGRVPPQNIEAEANLLGAALYNLAAAEQPISAEDFAKPAHGHIWDAIQTVRARGEQPNPVTVADQISRDGLTEAIGGLTYLTTIQGDAGPSSMAPSYARVVIEHANLRRLISCAGEIAELGYSTPADVGGATQHALELLTDVTFRANPKTCELLSPTLDEYLDATDAPHRWLVPGWLERMDRAVFVGDEGYGKSTLLRQIGFCASCGLHPWRPAETIDPISVLILDLENSPDQLRRELRKLRHLHDGPSRMRVEARPGGLDLLQATDANWLEALIAANQPDLIITGPTYKMMGGKADEERTGDLVRYLDRLRARHDFALLLEAHEGHATDGRASRPGRPINSSIWLRWPEFGINLNFSDNGATARLDRFRGDRDQREWPTTIGRGTPDTWPWVTLGETVSVATMPTAKSGWKGPERCVTSCHAWLQAHPGEVFRAEEMRKEIVDFTTRKGFRERTLREALMVLTTDTTSGVTVTDGPNRSLLYRYDEPETSGTEGNENDF